MKLNLLKSRFFWALATLLSPAAVFAADTFDAAKAENKTGVDLKDLNYAQANGSTKSKSVTSANGIAFQISDVNGDGFIDTIVVKEGKDEVTYRRLYPTASNKTYGVNKQMSWKGEPYPIWEAARGGKALVIDMTSDDYAIERRHHLRTAETFFRN
ncbi:MAG: hypothetical protein JNM63_00760 [Spirochaetia bacterium]|nr:hypothetical protein [Spirochaetia bacterium]